MFWWKVASGSLTVAIHQAANGTEHFFWASHMPHIVISDWFIEIGAHRTRNRGVGKQNDLLQDDSNNLFDDEVRYCAEWFQQLGCKTMTKPLVTFALKQSIKRFFYQQGLNNTNQINLILTPAYFKLRLLHAEM